jgi:hypothetical protein
MAQVAEQQTAADRLARLVERVRDWRSTRVRRSPMPAVLWEEAVRLGQQVGVHPVKAALGLNYESLRQRVADAAKSGSSAPRFVELRDGIQLPTVPAADIGSVVEIAEPDGLRLTVRLPPLSVRELSEFVVGLRRCRP